MMLVFGASDIKFFGWFFLVLGAVLVFLSGGVILRPTSLWQFFVAIFAMASGYKLFSS